MHRLLFSFLLIISFSSVLGADAPKPIAALVQQIQNACQARDLHKVKSCYDLEGASQRTIDTELSVWQEYFGQSGDNKDYTFVKIEYRSLNDMLNDKTVNPRSIEMMTNPHKMGESIYASNLTIIGFITVTFKGGSSSVGTVQPVGVTDDGSARLSMDRAVK